MNPFDLRGPDFLVFYLVLAIATCLALYWRRRSFESGPIPSFELNDPYLFAFLEGGSKQALKTSTISLIDRGLLTIRGKYIAAAPAAAGKEPKFQIEAETLHFFREQATFQDLLRASKYWNKPYRSYEEQLTSNKLLPDATIKSERHAALALAILILAGTAVSKITIALNRGRTNIGFLVVLSIIAVIVAVKIGVPHRTILGSRYLASVRKLFEHVRHRSQQIQAGGRTDELLWLTALFGVTAIPQSVFPFVRDLLPKSDGGSGCGSGGCGGGGCGGGGCGGCGGG